jgi:hypothetical protein
MMTSAHSFASTGEGYCYDTAVKYKNLMHKQVLADLDLEGGVNAGPETLKYSPDRYALDNLEEEFIFTILTGNAEDGFTNFIYTVVIEAWINTGNEAFICDVMSFSHEKTF